ncbi:autotransporter outer membrane beta-barrel domain-containing protein, partial [Avibacterium paragallinarum]
MLENIEYEDEREEALKYAKEKGYDLDESPEPEEPETLPDSGASIPQPPTQPSQPQQPTMSWLALAPRVNLEQGFASVRTLHERRGENRELKETEGQPWGRVLGDYLTQKGDENASFKLRDYGFQLGYDR